jgi:hypothetical protein
LHKEGERRRDATLIWFEGKRVRVCARREVERVDGEAVGLSA